MGIIYNEKARTFTLHTHNTTYQMQIDAYGFLLHLYYGRKTDGVMDYLLTYADRGFSGNPQDAGNDRTYSLDVLPQEFPCRLTGDFRSPVLDLVNADGSFGCDLRYQGYEICDGKYNLKGLPAVYAAEEEAQTLIIYMKDQVTGLQVELLYGVLPEYDVITRSAKVINTEEDKIRLTKAQAACIDFVHGEFDIISFYGRHAMERNMQRTPAGHGAFVIGSRRGTSSHQYNPMMILAEKETTEDAGTCYGMSFVYSGGFKAEVEKDQFGQTRMQMGLQEEQFSYPLEKGQEFVIPEVILTCSNQGLGKLSQNLQRCIRKNLCRGKYKEKVRPVLINSWEACYFDFTGEDIYHLAEQAKDLGIDMVVLDDGWFGSRNDDNSGLGDWKVNEEKLQGSLGDLISRINALGVKFGLWFEPEMVNEDSDLYREHPDWAIQIPGRKPVKGRNQLLLDFSRKEVVDAVYEQMCQVLDQGNIEYVKWDMNRHISDVYSAVLPKERQGEASHRYMLGLYDLLERLVSRYPDLLLEGCSGGGGRFDLGMLYYSPQIWCSDDTDAVERLSVQYGTSFCYPISTVGSHVSAVPNHQTGRITPVETRGTVAMAGSFGYELDLNLLSDGEKEEVKEQIKTFKKYYNLTHEGEYYRLTNPMENRLYAAWEFVSQDQSEALVHGMQILAQPSGPSIHIPVRGLKADAMYEVNGELVRSGRALMHGGLNFPRQTGDFKAVEFYLKEVK